MSLSNVRGVLTAGVAIAAAVCLSSLLLLTTSADAQSRRATCNDYANDAVKQSEINDRRNCGYKGSRWSDNRTAHFGWCMIFPRQARKENAARAEQLEECRDKRRSARAGRRASCETYAKIAVVQAQANRKYDCNNRGGEWRRRERPHFRWCMRARRDYLTDEIRYRAGELQKCFNKLGDDDDDTDDRGYKRRRFR